MLLKVRFSKTEFPVRMFPGRPIEESLVGEYQQYVFNNVTSPGFTNTILYQNGVQSLLRMGEVVEEDSQSKILEIKVLLSTEQMQNRTPPLFYKGPAFLSAGNYKTIVEIIEVKRFEDWSADYEMKMVEAQFIFQHSVADETKRWLAYVQ